MSNIVIKNVQFLCPARITFEDDGVENTLMGYIDYVGKRLYLEHPKDISNEVFGFLGQATVLPENAYQATDEIYEGAARAQDEYDTLHQKNVGEGNA